MTCGIYQILFLTNHPRGELQGVLYLVLSYLVYLLYPTDSTTDPRLIPRLIVRLTPFMIV